MFMNLTPTTPKKQEKFRRAAKLFSWVFATQAVGKS
jgi:hypothetical protein